MPEEHKSYPWEYFSLETGEALPSSEYSCWLIGRDHPLAGLCIFIEKETNLGLRVRKNSNFPDGFLVDAPPAVWRVVREAERVLSQTPEYVFLRIAADGFDVRDLRWQTVGAKVGQLTQLLSQCDESIIPEVLKGKIICSACKESIRFLEIAQEAISDDLPITVALPEIEKRDVAKKILNIVASEFGGKSIAPAEVGKVMSALIEKERNKIYPILSGVK